jgi:hypothetical protein
MSDFPYRLGRRPSPAEKRARTFRLASYFETLPAPPASVDYTRLGREWPMYLNDQLGDCTSAGAGHLEEVWSAEVDGVPYEVSDDDVRTFYEASTGYDPRDPDTDRGGDMLTVLECWRKAGIGGRKILAFAEVDASNQAEVKTALWLFSGLYVGVRLPRSAMEQFQAGKPWEVVYADGDIEGGHCVPAVAYDADGVTFVSWGRTVQAGWDWWRSYVMGASDGLESEVYAAISGDFTRLGQRVLPNGFNLAQLEADLAQLGG